MSDKLPDPDIGIQDRAIAALLDVADDSSCDSLARVIAAEVVLSEAKKRAKATRKKAK
jgi:hypothetical protein